LKRDDITRATLVIVCSVFLLLAKLSVPALAFYEWQSDNGSLDLRGLVRGFATAFKNPEDDFFYEDKSGAGAAAIARLIMQAQSGQHLSFEVNAYQTYIPASLLTSQGNLGTPLDVERSAVLECSFSDDEYVHLALDRLNVRWSHNRLDLIVGRQPINLATTFYFTPNDFFAPFTAQAFYRVYKPGIDALRAEMRLGDLSQLSLISVLGYEQNASSDTGWSDAPDGDRTSYVGRVTTVFRDFEWALLGGIVREVDIIGGSLQGELFQWLGIRAEGHFADPDDSQRDSYSELSFGIEHRWENSLNLRLEQFYHGSGAGSVSDYSTTATAAQGRGLYLGRNYTALGVGYEFTPLLSAEMLAIANLIDHSYLLSFNAVYSLSDEAELAVNLGAPIGKKPEGTAIKSEFGFYPYSFNIEVRFYF
jgi:hypothetical protein